MAEREVRSIAYHMKAARFPAYKDISGYDFAASEINEANVRQLHRCEFMDGAQNIVLVGGPGTGKTHVATALGVQAIEHHRRKARFFSTIELVNALEQEKAQRQGWPDRRDAWSASTCVILDELGYLPFSASGGALLFHLLSKLYERTSVIITTNLSFSEWANRFRRRQDDHRSARSSDPPLPHPGNRKRQLPLQGQLGRSSTEERRKGQSLDQTLIRKPYSEVAHFSVEKPAQFRAETNIYTLIARQEFHKPRYLSQPPVGCDEAILQLPPVHHDLPVAFTGSLCHYLRETVSGLIQPPARKAAEQENSGHSPSALPLASRRRSPSSA